MLATCWLTQSSGTWQDHCSHHVETVDDGGGSSWDDRAQQQARVERKQDACTHWQMEDSGEIEKQVVHVENKTRRRQRKAGHEEKRRRKKGSEERRKKKRTRRRSHNHHHSRCTRGHDRRRQIFRLCRIPSPSPR